MKIFLIETSHKDKHSELNIFYRDSKNKKHVKIVKDFKPYFYVDDSEAIPDDYRITGVETGHKDLFNNKVKKIFIQRSKDMYGVRKLFEKHYEADVPFPQRYIIDVLGEVETYKLHTLSLDIETDSVSTFPNVDDPDQAIISCAFADNRGFKRKYIFKSPDCKVDIEVDDITKVFVNEEQLLQGIVALINKLDPDVLTGWNVRDFDLAYLINRIKKTDINYHAMSPMGQVFCEKNERMGDDVWDIKIRGRIIIDGMEAYKHFRKMSNQGRAESYSLEFTGQNVLGVGKIQHEDNFHDMWVKNPNELLKYNLRDTELVIDILEKLEIIEFYDYIRAKSFALLDQIYQTTSLVDGYLLRIAHNKYVLPSKDKRSSEKYKGAYVFPPTPGLYDNVLALDLKALYPNIIKTFNVGFETFNPEGDIQLKEGIGFNKGIGLMSQIMRELEGERKIYKKKMWIADQANNEAERKLNHYKQYSVKVLMNSFYGYLGYPGSRLYKKEVAEAITEWGVAIIQWTKKVLNDMEYTVIYGDTDSVYVTPKTSSLFALLKEGSGLVKNINKSYTEFVETYGSDDCTLEMEFEKIFKKLLFVGKKDSNEGAKKKYAYILLWEDKKKVTNDVKFTGFETVRSDTPRISKKIQTEIVGKILNGIRKQEIVDILKELDNNIRTKKIPTEDIAFPKGISQPLATYGRMVIDEETGKRRKTGTPPVITGARYANKYLGKNFNQGSKPKWIYIKKVPPGYPNTKILAFEEDIPAKFQIDYDTMIEKIIRNKLEAILLASGFGEFPKIDARQQTL